MLIGLRVRAASCIMILILGAAVVFPSAAAVALEAPEVIEGPDVGGPIHGDCDADVYDCDIELMACPEGERTAGCGGPIRFLDTTDIQKAVTQCLAIQREQAATCLEAECESAVSFAQLPCSGDVHLCPEPPNGDAAWMTLDCGDTEASIDCLAASGQDLAYVENLIDPCLIHPIVSEGPFSDSPGVCPTAADLAKALAKATNQVREAACNLGIDPCATIPAAAYSNPIGCKPITCSFSEVESIRDCAPQIDVCNAVQSLLTGIYSDSENPLLIICGGQEPCSVTMYPMVAESPQTCFDPIEFCESLANWLGWPTDCGISDCDDPCDVSLCSMIGHALGDREKVLNFVPFLGVFVDRYCSGQTPCIDDTPQCVTSICSILAPNAIALQIGPDDSNICSGEHPCAPAHLQGAYLADCWAALCASPFIPCVTYDTQNQDPTVAMLGVPGVWSYDVLPLEVTAGFLNGVPHIDMIDSGAVVYDDQFDGVWKCANIMVSDEILGWTDVVQAWTEQVEDPGQIANAVDLDPVPKPAVPTPERSCGDQDVDPASGLEGIASIEASFTAPGLGDAPGSPEPRISGFNGYFVVATTSGDSDVSATLSWLNMAEYQVEVVGTETELVVVNGDARSDEGVVDLKLSTRVLTLAASIPTLKVGFALGGEQVEFTQINVEPNPIVADAIRGETWSVDGQMTRRGLHDFSGTFPWKSDAKSDSLGVSYNGQASTLITGASEAMTIGLGLTIYDAEADEPQWEGYLDLTTAVAAQSVSLTMLSESVELFNPEETMHVVMSSEVDDRGIHVIRTSNEGGPNPDGVGIGLANSVRGLGSTEPGLEFRVAGFTGTINGIAPAMNLEMGLTTSPRFAVYVQATGATPDGGDTNLVDYLHMEANPSGGWGTGITMNNIRGARAEVGVQPRDAYTDEAYVEGQLLFSAGGNIEIIHGGFFITVSGADSTLDFSAGAKASVFWGKSFGVSLALIGGDQTDSNDPGVNIDFSRQTGSVLRYYQTGITQIVPVVQLSGFKAIEISAGLNPQAKKVNVGATLTMADGTIGILPCFWEKDKSKYTNHSPCGSFDTDDGKTLMELRGIQEVSVGVSLGLSEVELTSKMTLGNEGGLFINLPYIRDFTVGVFKPSSEAPNHDLCFEVGFTVEVPIINKEVHVSLGNSFVIGAPVGGKDFASIDGVGLCFKAAVKAGFDARVADYQYTAGIDFGVV